MTRRSKLAVALGATLALATGGLAIARAQTAPDAAPPAGGAPARPEPGIPRMTAGTRAGVERAGGELRQGKVVYDRYCVGCHGEKGDGAGVAAPFLDPKPRDFRRGLFKFVSVPAGLLPRDDDLMKTITRGLRGTSMPSFRFVPEVERRAVIEYVKGFAAERYAEEKPGVLSPRGTNPYDPGNELARPVAEAVEQGRRLYHTIGCGGCHPVYLPADEFRAATKNAPRAHADRAQLTEDSWGNWIAPPDFTRQPLRASWTVEEIYGTITSGVGGAAMPTLESIPDEQRWQIAYYVALLVEKRGTIPGPPPRPVDPRQPAERK